MFLNYILTFYFYKIIGFDIVLSNNLTNSFLILLIELIQYIIL